MMNSMMYVLSQEVIEIKTYCVVQLYSALNGNFRPIH